MSARPDRERRRRTLIEDARRGPTALARLGAALCLGAMDAESGVDACPFHPETEADLRRRYGQGFQRVSNQHRGRATHASRSLPAEAM